MNLLELLLNNSVWCGSDESLTRLQLSLRDMTVEAAEKLVRDDRAARVKVGDASDDEEEEALRYNSASYDVIGNTAIIGVRGSLVNSDRWYLKFLGMVGYPHIQDRIAQARMDPNITNVVFHYDTPGGQANGIGETADAIKALAQEKVVTSFATQMCSGGYWLGSTVKDITVDKMAITGSIGVIVVHTDYSGYYKKNEIKHTVLRVGKYKALVSSVEPLTDAARAQIERQMNFIYDHFTQHVAEGLGMTQARVQEELGDGQVWLGAEAVSIGAAARVGTLGEVVARSRHLAENRGITFRVSEEGSEMTEAELKAKAEAEARVAAEAAKTQVADNAGDPAASAESATAETPTENATAVDANTVLIGELRTQVANKETDLINAKVELAAMKTQLDQAMASVSAMEGIVRTSLNHMNVALGGAAADFAEVSGSALVARHVETEKQFAARFPAGGVAAVQEDSTQAAAPTVAADDAVYMARVQATIASNR